jgi:predicted transcriptional regulator
MSNTDDNPKTHYLVWIKVTNEQAKQLDELAKEWAITRASLCRLVISQFLKEPEPRLTITKCVPEER